jgi:hypothetical protein
MRAAPLQQQDVTPTAVEHPQPLPGADDPESGPPVQRDARPVLGEDPGLDRPDAGPLGLGDQRLEQRPDVGDSAAQPTTSSPSIATSRSPGR